MFVELINCKECGVMFNIFVEHKLKEHYDGRRKIKRCVGCEKLDKYYLSQINKSRSSKN